MDAKTKREAADYEDYVSFAEEDAVSQLAKAKAFVKRIEEVLTGILEENEDKSPG